MVVAGSSDLTPAQAARALGVSRSTVMKMIERGELDTHMAGSHHRIDPASLRGFLRSERDARGQAGRTLAALQDELGLFN